MKKNDVKIGGLYKAKVTDKLTGVRIMKESPHGGWDAVNLATGKKVRIKSPARLRGPWNPRPAAKTPTSAPVAKTTARSNKDTTKSQEATRAKRSANSPSLKPQAPRLSGLDAAARILKEAGQPMSCKIMVQQMLEKGYWKTNGKTPPATIYAAIIREIATSIQKAGKSRFRKVGRGEFALNA